MANKIYCGLDFHKNVSELCIMDEEGRILDRVRTSAENLIKFLSNKPQYHIGIESSGGVFDVVNKMEGLGHKVTIINSLKFRGIGITGKKNDRNDAEALATSLRLGYVPEVYKKTLYARRLKSLLSSRDMVVKLRVALINHVRGIMREFGVPMPAGATNFWEHVGVRLKEIDCEVIGQTLSGLCDRAAELRDEEKRIEEGLEKLACEDERVKRLQSVPGVGPLTALAFVAVIEDASRFESAKRVASYLGITPRESSSANKKHFGPITKCGSEMLRRYLIHGARTAMRYEPKPDNKVRVWAHKLEKRIGKNKAVVALAHKNARICFALMRDASVFGVGKKKIKNAA